MPKAAAVKRSACDRCRAKRVRCPRAKNSTGGPCPRCVRESTPCVTGSSGVPGRPRKPPLVFDGSLPSSLAAESVEESSPGRSSGLRQHTGEDDDEEAQHAPGVHGHPFPADFHTALLGTDDASFFDFTSTTAVDSPALNSFAPGNFLSLGQRAAPPHPQGPLSASGGLDMIYFAADPSRMHVVDPFLRSFPCVSSTVPISRPSPTGALRDFGEKLERRASATRAFLADPRSTVEKCPEDESFEATATENPIAVLLTCTNEFIAIIQSLTARNGSSHVLLPDHSQLLLPGPTPSLNGTASPVSTETVLLVLSNYVTLMRLYNSTFHYAHQSLSQMPAEATQSLKVKSVFRIGGISSLQDLPAKLYAKGIFGTIQSHIRSLEDCLGLPPAYCLSGESTTSPQQQSTRGTLFAGEERARLLRSVMAQDDLQLKGEHKSFVHLVGQNMKKIEALFGV
ncbi:uncharacterized protein PG986_006517 [Apiospora aurea]|uniref:Zn(2)-C6 fungal-type domain-containing protein n=1 Tax=Apiospora aurea TaxID=335848 RepID=A0ABR1QKW0_9PEZI